MKNILFILFSLLISSQSFAASGSGNVSSVFSGGGGSTIDAAGSSSVTSSSATFPISSIGTSQKMLTATVGASADSFWKLYDSTNVTNSQYVAGGSSGLYIYKVCQVNFASASGHGAADQLLFQFGYGTADLSSDGTATPPAGVKYQVGAQSLWGYLSPGNRNICFESNIFIPTNGRPFVEATGLAYPAYIRVYGVEK